MSQTFICSQRVTPTLSEPFITPQNPQNDIGQMTSFYLGMEYLFYHSLFPHCYVDPICW